MTTQTAARAAGTVAVDGAELYYESTGAGPVLLTVPGLGSGAHTYRRLADALADRFQVVGYDRRGSLHSTGRVDRDLNLAQQSRDAVAILDAVGAPTAIVLGNCLGACIGFDLVVRYPDRISAFVAHEPATLRILPDADRHLDFARRMVERGEQEGPVAAMMMWLEEFGYDFSRPLTASFQERTEADGPYQLRYEMMQLATVIPDIAALRHGHTPLVMAVGEQSPAHTWFGRTPAALADLLDCPLARFPGGHAAHVDQPQPYGDALTAAVRGLLVDA